jgi:hypothetical protein
MDAMQFVWKYEPDAQPLYPPAAVCIGVETRFKTSELGFVRGTKHKARCFFTGVRSRILSATFWREGEGYSWQEAHRLAWEDAAKRIRECGAWEVVG